MTGEYSIKVNPSRAGRLNASEINWRNADQLQAEITVNIDGKEKTYIGFLTEV